MDMDEPVVRHIYISPGHNYRGHHGREPDAHTVLECDSVHCVAGRGLEGDRYFDHAEDFKGQVTLFSWEVFQELCDTLNVHDRPASVLRRNVIVAGVDLKTLIGRRFTIQGIVFEGSEECRPCYWMDRALAPGAERAMAGKGGLRARILTSGVLHSKSPSLQSKTEPLRSETSTGRPAEWLQPTY